MNKILIVVVFAFYCTSCKTGIDKTSKKEATDSARKITLTLIQAKRHWIDSFAGNYSDPTKNTHEILKKIIDSNQKEITKLELKYDSLNKSY